MTRDARAVRQRRLLSRNGNALACTACGKAIVPKPGSRRQKYCRDACKMKAARAKKWAKRYEIPDPLRSVENIQAKSTSCKGDFGGRAFPTKAPLNLIGGYSWSDATSVDPKLIAQNPEHRIATFLRRVRSSEFSGGWSHKAVAKASELYGEAGQQGRLFQRMSVRSL